MMINVNQKIDNDFIKLWQWKKLSELADTTSGGTPRRNCIEYFKGNINWFKSGELKDAEIFDSEEKITLEAIKDSNAKILPKGTLLIAMYGATVGKLGVLGVEAATNQAICAIFPKKQFGLPLLNNWFLFYYFKSIRYQLIHRSFGAAQPNISQRLIKETYIPIPFPKDIILSIDIQNRIVSRIESLLGELKGDHQLLNKIRRDTSRFIEMKLEEIFENLPSVRQPLIEVIESPPRNEWSPKCDDNPNGTPVLKLGAVLRFQYNPDEFKRTSLPTDPNAHYWLKPGDVLISRSNTLELVGHAAIYSGTPFPCIYPDLMMRIRVDQSKADSRFLVYWLQSKEVRHFIQSRASGASPTMKKINQGHVCNIPFPVISVEEQRQLAHYLKSLQSEVNEMLKTMQQDAKLLERLEQSILEKAFQGQL
jgi:type I restriction enzyme S subunit